MFLLKVAGYSSQTRDKADRSHVLGTAHEKRVAITFLKCFPFLPGLLTSSKPVPEISSLGQTARLEATCRAPRKPVETLIHPGRAKVW